MKKNEELTLMHYKEPLREAGNGYYGYLGAISVTLDGDKIQCHLCGRLYRSLAMHIYNTHKMKTLEYREKFQLAKKTALVSETFRMELKQRTLDWLSGLSEEEKSEYIKKTKERYKEHIKDKTEFHRFRISLETKNKRGTCPDQLIAKIIECKEALGHVPSKKEFIAWCGSQRFVHLIYKTFGSWVTAVKKADLTPKPHYSGKNIKKKRYDRDELLEYLQIFYDENGKIPTETDFNRGLLPPASTYAHHFGGIPKARELAGITETPSRWK